MPHLRIGKKGRLMPIAIAGMHRSGTSMVAAMLARSGLYLGPERDLMPPGPDNEYGYWENRKFVSLNEAVLQAFGSSWDNPPSRIDLTKSEVLKLLRQAEALSRSLSFRQPWAWKDPRNTVTLPFWLKVFPKLRIVGCVRSPFEVAHSLNRRDGFTLKRGLALWLTYNRRLLESAPADQLVLTHYEAYFVDPVKELRRVLVNCGIEPLETDLQTASVAVKPALHHNRVTSGGFASERLSREVVELYASLCERAGWKPAAELPRLTSGSPGQRRKESVRTNLQGHVRKPTRIASDSTIGTPVLPRKSKLRGSIGQTRSTSGSAIPSHEVLSLPDLDQRIGRETPSTAQQSLELAELRAELSELRARVDEAESPESADTSALISRRRAGGPFREAVMEVAPPGSRVLVVTSGDTSLLELRTRRGEHFPQDISGGYSEMQPASDLAAIAQLEVLRYRVGLAPYLAMLY